MSITSFETIDEKIKQGNIELFKSLQHYPTIIGETDGTLGETYYTLDDISVALFYTTKNGNGTAKGAWIAGTIVSDHKNVIKLTFLNDGFTLQDNNHRKKRTVLYKDIVDIAFDDDGSVSVYSTAGDKTKLVRLSSDKDALSSIFNYFV